MEMSLTLYDALTTASIPANKAKAVVDAWEADMKNLATKSDLLQTEARLESRLDARFSEQGSVVRELGSEMRAQGVELRALIKEQGADLRSSISALESQNKILRWQFGLIFICVAVPLLKTSFEMLSR
ncbi:DUF1640 domain-containing protein [Pseudomonas gingeri NCPPB 3146 = LMG 5327]|uniref:DUF1640 domain-containing protein n=2 Tax=Pseudomonas gingeri TaxID=117681 RepID=A0A7Y8CBH2_9PSED|nr:hypothetical protein [Pseudomonas gingeri]NWC12734.1 DUF1640 domain-containing protein [Pseudomonas gingeri]NWD06578.1 DUF1640 domain-containing protein [Pseudomonas gingeri]NWE33142.1 DUF1640 domain-containing protein [Pseudomonas gingeri]NWE49497.1 DUF1640 domain-containing protein [Pseudomonas gingeri]NWE55520.1 DUF1640 domain-containing protein [Pseudomonas gingeri]